MDNCHIPFPSSLGNFRLALYKTWTGRLDHSGIVQNMDWTGLDSWTGQLDWTAGLDSWTGLLDWDSFLLNRRNSMFLRKVK